MAFKTEDGTGVIGATTYGTVAGFNAYHTDRGNDLAGLNDTVVQELLVKATDYINTRWGLLFKGTREYNGLISRSVLTLTANAANDETVTVGDVTYTFKTTPSPTDDTEVEVGSSAYYSLVNLSAALGASDNEVFVDTFFVDPDVNAMTIFVADDDTVTTETLANGTFDQATSYGSSFRLQPLEFPRNDLYDSEGVQVLGVPDKLKYATYEYALRANTAALAPDPTVNSSGEKLTAERQKVGPIEIETRFSASAAIVITRPYPAADRLLSEYVQAKTGVVRN